LALKDGFDLVLHNEHRTTNGELEHHFEVVRRNKRSWEPGLWMRDRVTWLRTSQVTDMTERSMAHYGIRIISGQLAVGPSGKLTTFWGKIRSY